ncbi:MAG: hypothetical protein WEE53_08600 [Acidimicrobiia bacterium]
MTTFPGTVAFEDDRVPVTVGIDIDKITLISGEIEIGEWPAAECTFVEKGDGSWVIEAEDDSVFFLPDDPSRFARGLAGHLIIDPDSLTDAMSSTATTAGAGEFTVAEGPAPKPLTVVGFYALCLVTLALGAWAVVSLLS